MTHYHFRDQQPSNVRKRFGLAPQCPPPRSQRVCDFLLHSPASRANPPSQITTASMSFGVPLPESESEFPSYPHYPQRVVYRGSLHVKRRAAPSYLPTRPVSGNPAHSMCCPILGGNHQSSEPLLSSSSPEWRVPQ